MGDNESWKTLSFRQYVMSKIEEAVQQSRARSRGTRSSSEIENYVFQEAKSKEEYLRYATRLVLLIRALNKQDEFDVLDLTNSLQALAIQGTNNPLIQTGEQQPPTANNLLQNLNYGAAKFMNIFSEGLQPSPKMVISPNGGLMPSQIGDEYWREESFRHSVVMKISEEKIRLSGVETSQSSLEMENYIFQRVQSEDEYLGYIAQLIQYMPEMRTSRCEQSTFAMDVL